MIVTEWNEFRALEWPRLKKVMKRPLVVDLRNIYEPSRVALEGFSYHSVGRPDADPTDGES